MNILVGIPTYDGKLMTQLVSGLLAETSVAAAMGDQITVRFLPSCSNIAIGRNQIVKEFLASEFDRLVFVDADVTFEPGSLVRLAHYPVEFVGGAYRLKQPKEQYPVSFLNSPNVHSTERMGLIEVAMVPTGFLALSKSVFEKFSAHYPGREYDSAGTKTYCYFQVPYHNGALYTEDSYFCKEWRESGGKIFLDPEISMTHWDFNVPYAGNLGECMRQSARESA
jgi:hypothetical protein